MTLNFTDREYQYIENQLEKVDGVGKKTAAKIIGLVDSFSGFSEINKKHLESLSYNSGRSVLNSNQVEEIISIIEAIDFNEEIMILEVEEIISDFIHSTYKKIKELDLDILDINPFLIRALKFDSAEEIISFYLYQRITRSIVTSWGMTVEKIAKSCGAKDVPRDENVEYKGKKFDIKKKVKDISYYIQVKSGPNTMNVGMVESLNEMIGKIEKQDDTNKGILGMTFGNREALSSQISGNLKNIDENSKIGKEFWDFISQKSGFTEELLDMISEASKKYETKEGGKKLSDLINKKKSLLLKQWEELYNGTDEESIKKVEQLNL